MKSDLEIAREASLKPIEEIASKISIPDKYLRNFGKHVAKVSHSFSKEIATENGNLIVVTAMTPTPAGEGKTTTSIGLSMALNKIGHKSIVTLREPSLGPVLGIKGGAAGGGYSQVLPMEDINLHFTGDIHAVTSAHNLISAMIDAHIKFGNKLNIDQTRISWPRTMDMNDRALREIIVGLGGRANGYPRQDGFIITAASEIMATLCVADDIPDLKERVGKIVIGWSKQRKPIRVADLGIQGSIAVLLKDAIDPNLVQTIENTPAFVHGGPFANIAHGTNSVIATKLALKLADYVITETGFGSDLGAEKFFDFVSPLSGLKPSCVVVVATVRALKYHGGVGLKNLENEDVEAVEKGFENLRVHIENMRKFGLPVVVALNRFHSDTSKEIEAVMRKLEAMGVPGSVNEAFEKGSEGAIDLAKKVSEMADSTGFKPLYSWESSLKEKIQTLAREIYRAKDVVYTHSSERALSDLEKEGFGNLPVIVAKTQYSITDDATQLGAPTGHTFTVRDISLSAGAGFVVVIAGNIMRMPGLGKNANALYLNIDENGNISGLF